MVPSIDKLKDGNFNVIGQTFYLVEDDSKVSVEILTVVYIFSQNFIRCNSWKSNAATSHAVNITALLEKGNETNLY